MTTDTQAAVAEIADVIRRAGKRDDVIDNIAENIDFSELIAEQLKVEGPVREQAIKVITTFLKNFEIESDTDEATDILRAINFAKFVPTLLQNEEFQEVIIDAIQELIENRNLDISEAIAEAIESKDLKKHFDSEECRAMIAKKIQVYVEDFDMSNLDEDVTDELYKTLFSFDRLEASLKNNEDLDELVKKRVIEYVEETNDESPIATAITESKVFRAAVDTAIEELIESGKVSRLVEKVATDMLSENDSSLRSQLTTAISTQLVNRIAGSIVERAFK